MKKSSAHGDFIARPGAAERWIHAKTPTAQQKPDQFTARLTIDVTPAMRRRLKLAALTQGVTVADLMRGLINAHFPDCGKEQI